MARDEHLVRFEKCLAVKETTLGLCVRIPEHGEVWLPKSQIHDDSEVYEDGGEGELVITEFIATEKGLV